MKEMLERIKGDFFSIMAPGFHLLVALLILILSSSAKYNKYLDVNHLMNSAINLNSYWPLYILAVFLAYLFGNFLRAIPVRNADNLCKKLFSWTAGKKSSLVAIYYSDSFPYHSALTRLLDNLRANGFPKDLFSVPDKSTVHTAFNFFKTVLCAESPSAFEYTQTLESRVRLFAGMFWSSCVAIAISLILGILALISTSSVTWSPFHTGLLFASLAVAVLLGGQLPRVRGQEVEYVFLAYLAYLVRTKRKLQS